MQNKGPLSGVKVMDFTHVLSGTYTTMILGDLGAEIIKVERREGDSLRETPPLNEGQSAYFFCSNRNKRGISIDLKKEKARQVVYKMVEECDVFVENFRPGVMDRLGLGYDKIRSIKEDIIYGSLSAFGEIGPLKNVPGFELIIQSMIGLVHVQSGKDGKPFKVQPQIVDFVGGMFLGIAIMGALYHKANTGKGQRVTTSLIEGLSAMMVTFYMMNFFGRQVQPGLQSRNPMMFPSQSFKCKDGYFSTVATPNHWERICKALGKPEWINDEELSNVRYRVENYDKMEALVEEITVTKNSAEWEEIFTEHQVAFSKINTIADFLEHPQCKALKLFVDVDHPTIGKVKLLRPPWNMSETPSEVYLAPPMLGQHSAEILSETGFSKEEIADLIEDGVVIAQ
jgi:CoA:oxalate CoA-transferase